MTPYNRLLAQLSRRDLLKAAWWLGVAAIAQRPAVTRAQGKPIFLKYPFSMGVASGDPLPASVVLWTRLAPEPLEGGGMPAAVVEVEWEVALDSEFADVVRKGTTLARPELGHSVHVDVNGLKSGWEYFYRFRAGDEVSPVGRTKTAPPEGMRVDTLRFGVCGCSHYEQGYFSAYRRISEERFDFVFHTGDYIYETRTNAPSVTKVREHRGQRLYTVEDYRNRYGQYKSDPSLMAAHASAPFIMSFDDHEVDNNYAGDTDQQDTPPELFLLRRAAAYQAYYEAMPLRAAQFPSGGHLQLHRRLQFGSLVDFSVLDTRQYRSNQACGGGTKTNCAEALDPRRTMLGAEQEKWLFDHLATVRAAWTVLGQQVPVFSGDDMAVAPNNRFSMDRWDGYAAARDRLLARLAATKAPNPIVLSGDVHQHYGGDIKLDFRNPRSATVGVEFTNSSLSSGGDGDDVTGKWPHIKADNPHIKFHSGRRGYIACTATPTTMRADFKVLDRVTVDNLPVRTAGSLVVEANRAGAQTD